MFEIDGNKRGYYLQIEVADDTFFDYQGKITYPTPMRYQAENSRPAVLGVP